MFFCSYNSYTRSQRVQCNIAFIVQVYGTCSRWLISKRAKTHPDCHRVTEQILYMGVGHLDHDEAMEAGGREFDPRPGHYSRMSF